MAINIPIAEKKFSLAFDYCHYELFFPIQKHTKISRVNAEYPKMEKGTEDVTSSFY